MVPDLGQRTPEFLRYRFVANFLTSPVPCRTSPRPEFHWGLPNFRGPVSSRWREGCHSPSPQQIPPSPGGGGGWAGKKEIPSGCQASVGPLHTGRALGFAFTSGRYWPGNGLPLSIRVRSSSLSQAMAQDARSRALTFGSMTTLSSSRCIAMIWEKRDLLPLTGRRCGGSMGAGGLVGSVATAGDGSGAGSASMLAG